MRLPRARRQWALVATAVIDVVSEWRSRLDGRPAAYLSWDNGAGMRTTLPVAHFTFQSGPLFMYQDVPRDLVPSGFTAQVTPGGR